jgi:hypothetical protein
MTGSQGTVIMEEAITARAGKRIIVINKTVVT